MSAIFTSGCCVMFVPEARAVVAPSPQVDQLEAVVTATAEQLAVVGADVQ